MGKWRFVTSSRENTGVNFRAVPSLRKGSVGIYEGIPHTPTEESRLGSGIFPSMLSLRCVSLNMLSSQRKDGGYMCDALLVVKETVSKG